MSPSLPDRQLALDRLAELGKRITDGTEAQRERDDLVRELHAAGWTQAELAAAVGITQQRISRIIKTGTEKI